MLRDYYKAEYKKALHEKVEHQRRTIQQRQSKLDEQVKTSQEHEVCSNCLEDYHRHSSLPKLSLQAIKHLV